MMAKIGSILGVDSTDCSSLFSTKRRLVSVFTYVFFLCVLHACARYIFVFQHIYGPGSRSRSSSSCGSDLPQPRLWVSAIWSYQVYIQMYTWFCCFVDWLRALPSVVVVVVVIASLLVVILCLCMAVFLFFVTIQPYVASVLGGGGEGHMIHLVLILFDGLFVSVCLMDGAV